MQEALFAISRESRNHCKLGRLSLVTLKMVVICSSKTSVLLTRDTWHHAPKDNVLNHKLNITSHNPIGLQSPAMESALLLLLLLCMSYVMGANANIYVHVTEFLTIHNVGAAVTKANTRFVNKSHHPSKKLQTQSLVTRPCQQTKCLLPKSDNSILSA